MGLGFVGYIIIVALIVSAFIYLFKVSSSKRPCPQCRRMMPRNVTKCPGCGTQIPLNY